MRRNSHTKPRRKEPQLKVTTTEPNAFLNDLVPGTTYEINVTAVNDAGESQESTKVQVTA